MKRSFSKINHQMEDQTIVSDENFMNMFLGKSFSLREENKLINYLTGDVFWFSSGTERKTNVRKKSLIDSYVQMFSIPMSNKRPIRTVKLAF